MAYKKIDDLKYGFTLIEIMTVIAIIGVLTAVVFGVYSAGRERAQNAHTITAASEMFDMMIFYLAANDKYPTTSTFPSRSICLVGSGDADGDGIYDCEESGAEADPDFNQLLRDSGFNIGDSSTAFGITLHAICDGDHGTGRCTGGSHSINDNLLSGFRADTSYYISYMLKGTKRDCGLQPVLRDTSSNAMYEFNENSGGADLKSDSTYLYSAGDYGNSGEYTKCAVWLPPTTGGYLTDPGDA